MRQWFANDEEYQFFVEKWRQVRNGDLDTWDFSWCYALLARKGLAVQPHVNLVENIGVGDPRATHTTRDRRLAHTGAASVGDLLGSRPPAIQADPQADRQYFRSMIAGRHRRLKHLRRRIASLISSP